MRKEQLADMVKSMREHKQLLQDDLATQCNLNRSIIAHLEQGRRIPKPDQLKIICENLSIPSRYWEPFTAPQSLQRFEFEETLAELCGSQLDVDGHDPEAVLAVENQIDQLFRLSLSAEQTRQLLNSILVFYGATTISADFFRRYLEPSAFSSTGAFAARVREYQKDAIRLFSTLSEAFLVLNRADALDSMLATLSPREPGPYYARTDWNFISEIPDEQLPDLGYISAVRVRQQEAERKLLKTFLVSLAEQIKKRGLGALDEIPEKKRRKMDTLLRKFDSTIKHGLFSPLFPTDHDAIEREAARLAPRTSDQLERMQETQSRALGNLANYLAADHMDVYIATSMREDADFVSANRFVRELFAHDLVRPLKLRYFNPTQSWIDDRIAKGLVEALMLRRADITIYMAQKVDSFGKDCEASVALGQGKPVIVYVPKLVMEHKGTDTEELFKISRGDLLNLLSDYESSDEIDESMDETALVGRLLSARLEEASDSEICATVRRQWADFDLYGEADRILDVPSKAPYRKWLDEVLDSETVETIPAALKNDVLKMLVGVAIGFESRAKLFREIHPLALQVILSTGVLNGILVVRSVNQCAEVLKAVITNNLRLNLITEPMNYRLVEEKTGSTVRVISRHQLLQNAFNAYYAAARGASSGF